MDPIDELLGRAARSTEGQPADGLPAPPSMKVAVVTCMDARFSVHALFGLRPGEAHAIRNAGGVLTDDAIRSLAISQHMLGTEAIMLIRHTGCGLHGLDDGDLADRLEAHAGSRPAWRGGGFTELEGDLRRDLAELRSNPYLLSTDSIRGFVLETDSGRLTEVE